MKNISIKAVIIGAIVDIVSTNIFSIPFIIYLMVKIHNPANSDVKLTTDAMVGVIHASPVLFSVQILIGAMGSILGGYISAKIAKHDELLHGSLSSFLCVGSGFYALVTGSATESIFLILLGFIMSPTLGLLGGYLRARQTIAREVA